MPSAFLVQATLLIAIQTAATGFDACDGKKVQTLLTLAPEQIKLQKYSGDPHGPDPRGCDPRDEQHDANLPANREDKAYKAPKDVYGDKYPNSRAPY